jgi:hypothetical protein
LFEHFLYRHRLEIEISLYFTSEFTPRIHEFRETERAIFSEVTIYKSVKNIFSIELYGVPRLRKIGVKEFSLNDWVVLFGCLPELWEFPHKLLREQL